MGRHCCCVKHRLRKGLWSPEEDEKLFNYITRFGVSCWSSIPILIGLQRCGKSCRLRWINYLRPDLKRGMFSQQEEDLILSLHKVLGNKWARIAVHLPGRTDNEIKNFWNSCLKKKLMRKGINPNTHKPLSATEARAVTISDKKIYKYKNSLDQLPNQIIASTNSAGAKELPLVDALQNPSCYNTNYATHGLLKEGAFGEHFDPMTSSSLLEFHSPPIDPTTSIYNSSNPLGEYQQTDQLMNLTSSYYQNQFDLAQHNDVVGYYSASMPTLTSFEFGGGIMCKPQFSDTTTMMSSSNNNNVSNVINSCAINSAQTSNNRVENVGTSLISWPVASNNNLESVQVSQFSGIRSQDYSALPNQGDHILQQYNTSYPFLSLSEDLDEENLHHIFRHM